MAMRLLQQQTASLAAHTGRLTVSPPGSLPTVPTVADLPGPDGPWSREQLIELVCRKARQFHLEEWEFLALILAEGMNPRASRPVSQEDWRAYWEPPYPTFDVSFGLGQRSVRYSVEYAAWCRANGINPESSAADAYPGDAVIASIRDVYFDPYYALDVTAETYHYWRYNPEVPYLTAACAYNLPASYHSPESNPNYRHYRDCGILAQRDLGIEDITPPTGRDLVFGIDVPDIVIRQANNWTCSVRSVYAGLWQMAQIGLIEPVTYGDGGPRDVYDWMVPQYANAEWGLLLHTGAGMVEMLRSHGLRAGNQYPARLGDVQARAGRQPVMLGGKSWNHWCYVRGQESDGTLILENPAPGFGGITDRLRDSLPRLGDENGAVSIVWIDL